MKTFFSIQSLLLVMVLGLAACGGSDNKNSGGSSSKAASSTPASSSVAAVSNVMEAGKEYPYSANTKITNTGKTDLVVSKKYYWDSQKTVVVLKEGSATID